ncbi:MAG TPA: ATP-binding protein [Chryseosolibacter sp.]
MKKKISVSWSGGKDSAFALYKILSADEYEVVGLHTVLNAETRRVGMHGVQESLIEAQAASLRLPVEKLFLEPSESHAAYTELIHNFYDRCVAQGIVGIMFGDIFLEDLKKFRDEVLQQHELVGIYPLWNVNSSILIHDFINLGFQTMVCSANADLLPKHMVGATIDATFVASLPANADPCGENGEYHSFVYSGPIFHAPINLVKGEVVERVYRFRTLDEYGEERLEQTAFWFQDLSLS